MSHTPLGPGGEFDAVRAIIARLGASAQGVGDDAGAFMVPPGEVGFVSTDVAVEDVHFRRAWFTAEEIGYRSAAAALSDLAAMAATPRAVVIALTLPGSWRADAPAIAAGIAAAAQSVGAPVVGGDLSDGPTLAIAITVIGSTRAPLTRRGAQVGQGIWVTGRLGGPALALAAHQAGAPVPPRAQKRFARPTPRIREAFWLAGQGATACIDISDGLSGDLSHIAAASGVRLIAQRDVVPRVEGASVEQAVSGGEEYELAVTAPQSLDAAAFTREFNTPLTCIGEVRAGDAGVDWHSAGASVAVPHAFDHFDPSRQ